MKRMKRRVRSASATFAGGLWLFQTTCSASPIADGLAMGVTNTIDNLVQAGLLTLLFV